MRGWHKPGQNKGMQQEWQQILSCPITPGRFPAGLATHPELQYTQGNHQLPTPATLFDIEQILRHETDTAIRLHDRQTNAEATYRQKTDKRDSLRRAHVSIRPPCNPPFTTTWTPLQRTALMVPNHDDIYYLYIENGGPFANIEHCKVDGQSAHILQYTEYHLQVRMNAGLEPRETEIQAHLVQNDPQKVAEDLANDWNAYWQTDSENTYYTPEACAECPRPHDREPRRGYPPIDLPPVQPEELETSKKRAKPAQAEAQTAGPYPNSDSSQSKRYKTSATC